MCEQLDGSGNTVGYTRIDSKQNHATFSGIPSLLTAILLPPFNRWNIWVTVQRIMSVSVRYTVASSCRYSWACTDSLLSSVCGVSASRADWPVIRLQCHSSCIAIDVDAAADAAAAEAGHCTAISSTSLRVSFRRHGHLTGCHRLTGWLVL